jgi:hypothetical protein
LPNLVSTRIHLELTEPAIRAILVLCRMNEYQSLMIEALVGGTDLTEHKATVAQLKVEMTQALQRQQAVATQVAVAEANRTERERAATGVVPFPAAADAEQPADIPLQR